MSYEPPKIEEIPPMRAVLEKLEAHDKRFDAIEAALDKILTIVSGWKP